MTFTRSTAGASLLIVLMLAGCSSGTSPASVSTTNLATAPTTTAAAPQTSIDMPIDVPTGYVLYDGTQDGFQIALPEDWTAFGPDDADFGELITEVSENSDAFEDTALEGMGDTIALLFDQGGVLWAFDVEGSFASEFVDNINVIRLPSAPLSVSGVLKMAEAQFEALGADLISTEQRTVPAGEAIIVTYDLPDFGNSGISATVVSDEYDWTISIATQDVDAMTIVADVIIESLRMTP